MRKKKGRILGNNFMDGIPKSNSGSLVFKKVEKNEKNGKKKEKALEKGKSQEEDAAIWAFYQEKRQFFESFDTTCLATTPMKK